MSNMKEDVCVINVDGDAKNAIVALKDELKLKNTREVVKLLLAVTDYYRLHEVPDKDDPSVMKEVDVLPLFVKQLNLEFMKKALPKVSKSVKSVNVEKTNEIDKSANVVNESESVEEEEEFETLVEVGL